MGRINGLAKSFGRHIEPVHPIRWITKCLGARRIPAAKRHESYLMLLQVKGFGAHVVRGNIRLERIHAIGAELELEKRIEAGIRYARLHHDWCEICEECHPKT